MTTKEMIEVMLAYERGEQIEYRERICNCIDDWLPLKDDNPFWDWYGSVYRVKPQPTYRPYKNAEEFLKAQKEHGMYIRPKNNADRYELPTSICDGMFVFLLPTNDGRTYSICYYYDNLLADKVWQDGTPCGVKEE